ncbi:MAG: FHA domain-containing protein [Kangiellaceae bacterium]|nr:FHA domain-containing protein [Kangiellaceae bacterium]
MAYLALIIEDVIINKWELTEEVTILGRARDCDIQIDDQSVSSKHARIVSEPDPYLKGNRVLYLEDLRSTNGTQLNNLPVTKEKLSDGDDVKIGFTDFQYFENQQSGLDDTSVIIS